MQPVLEDSEGVNWVCQELCGDIPVSFTDFDVRKMARRFIDVEGKNWQWALILIYRHIWPYRNWVGFAREHGFWIQL
jgi:hypothetical protein